MAFRSLDPRVNRLNLPEDTENFVPASELDQWATYEVFHQAHRGEHHVHVGPVHAPNAEMALLFAKEQYGRRQHCVNMWVVRSADIMAFEYEDSDMFETAPEKLYRESSGYKNREKVEDFHSSQLVDDLQEEGEQTAEEAAPSEAAINGSAGSPESWRTGDRVATRNGKQRRTGTVVVAKPKQESNQS